MTLEEALYLFLTSDVAVAALITNGQAAPRLLPQRMVMGAVYPYATYQRISTVRAGSLSGDQGLVMARMELRAYGFGVSGYSDAKGLAIAIRQATGGTAGNPESGSVRNKFHGFRGWWGPVTTGLHVHRCWLDSPESDAFDIPVHSEEVGTQHVRTEAEIWFEESN